MVNCIPCIYDIKKGIIVSTEIRSRPHSLRGLPMYLSSKAVRERCVTNHHFTLKLTIVDQREMEMKVSQHADIIKKS